MVEFNVINKWLGWSDWDTWVVQAAPRMGCDPLVLSHPSALPNPILNSLYTLKQLFANLSLFLHPLFSNRNKATLLPCSSSQPPLHPQLITFLFRGFSRNKAGILSQVHKVYYPEIIWWLCSRCDYHWCNLLFQLTICGTSPGSHPGHHEDLGPICEKQLQ